MLNKIEEVGSSKSTFYTLLGGEETGTAVIRQLVETFYDVMDSDSKAAPIRAMHPADLTASREKLFMFLTGWTGGHNYILNDMGIHFCGLNICLLASMKVSVINGCTA